MSAAIPMRELVDRLCADRGIVSVDTPRPVKSTKSNLLLVDGALIIRAAVLKGREVLEGKQGVSA